MKKQCCLIALAALFCSHAFAQPPLTADDIETNIGVTFTTNAMDTAVMGTAGNNQLWDFTFLSHNVGQAQDHQIVEFGSTGNEDLFPNANMAFSIGSGESYHYISLTDDAYAIAGRYGPGPIELFYFDPQNTVVFPAELGVAFTDSFVVETESGIEGGNMFGEADMEVDGYGDITMPWGTIEGAYRVSGTVDYVNTSVVEGDTIVSILESTSTTFFAPGFPAPVISVVQGVLTIPEMNVTQDVENTSFISNFSVNTDDLVVNDLQIFPNPASHHLTIDFEKRDAQPVQVDLLNVQGRIVQSAGQIGAGFGHFQSQIDVSKLPAGFYLLRLAAGESSQVVKVAVQ